MGLLLPHKSTVRVYPDMVTVSDSGEKKQSGGGKRGEIEIFSSDARYRLLRLLHMLEYQQVAFVTLTYPANFPTNPRVYKAHLKEFRRRFERLYGRIRAIWRLEFQKRGAPHYHIMYLDAPFVPVKELCWLWKCVTKTIDMAHEQNGVDLKLIVGTKEKRLIVSYVAKYIAKVDKGLGNESTNKVGRYYGRWNIVETPPVEFEISNRHALSIVRYALMCSGGGALWEPTDPERCTVFGCRLGSREFSFKILEFKAMLGRSDRE